MGESRRGVLVAQKRKSVDAQDAGSLRYHLGLVTANRDACFISVDGNRYYWRDGEGLLFDETYIHFVENNTDETRLVLLCDVERPLRTRIMTGLNRWIRDSLPDLFLGTC